MPTELYLRSLQYTKKIGETWSYFDLDTSQEVTFPGEVKNSGAYEYQRHSQPDPLKQSFLPNPDIPIQAWFKGAQGISTTKYNPGQRYYYSPVGFAYQIADDKQVLANFKGDGNVGANCQLSYVDSEGLTLIHRLCNDIASDQKIMANIVPIDGLCRAFFSNVKRQNISIEDEAGLKYINELMSTYQDGSDLGNEIRDCIRSAAIHVLIDYYKKRGEKQRYSGSGLTTSEEFATAEDGYRHALPGNDVVIGTKKTSVGITEDVSKYTESVVHGTTDNIKYVFCSVDMQPIAYPMIIDSKWVIKEGASDKEERSALKERLGSMLELYDELQKAKIDIKFAILDKDGIINETPNKSDIEDLLRICDSSEKDWQKQLEEKLQHSFTRLGPTSQSSAVDIWQPSASHGEITTVKPLSMSRIRIPQNEGNTTELSSNTFAALRKDVQDILTRTSDMDQVQKALKKLTKKYHPDKAVGLNNEIIVMLNQIRGTLETAVQLGVPQKELLLILGNAESVQPDETIEETADSPSPKLNDDPARNEVDKIRAALVKLRSENEEEFPESPVDRGPSN